MEVALFHSELWGIVPEADCTIAIRLQPDTPTAPLPMRFASMGYTSMGFTSRLYTSIQLLNL
jgi:hypothetical protein